MPTKKPPSKADWLVGRWQASEGFISVLFIFEKQGDKFRVRGFEESDGEELIISNVNWDGTILAFETLMPSTQWRTKNRFKAVSKNKAIQEITHWEPWKKVIRPRNQPRRLAASARRVLGGGST